jgi:hypothetical protein
MCSVQVTGRARLFYHRERPARYENRVVARTGRLERPVLKLLGGGAFLEYVRRDLNPQQLAVTSTNRLLDIPDTPQVPERTGILLT